MDIIIHDLFFILVANTLICVAILIVALYHWRKHPSFINILNFKRPCWLTLFISLGMIILGFVCGELVSLLFHLFHIHYDPKGFIYLPFILLIFLGGLCCMVSSICCLWYLIAAIFSYVRAKQNGKK
jgi:hypothetical protein